MLLDAAGLAVNAAWLPRKLKVDGTVMHDTNIWKAGLLFGRGHEGMLHGLHNAVRGQLPFVVLGAGLSAGMASKSHALSAASKSIGATIGGITGATFGGGAGMIAGQYLGDKVLGNGIAKGVQAIADFGAQIDRINMGGDYKDSQAAWTMRQVAVREMSRSSLGARRYLGQEAAFLHT